MAYIIPKYTCRLVRDGAIAVAVQEVHTAIDAAEIFFELMRGLDRERMYSLYLNGGNKAIGVECVSMGGLHGCAVTARDVLCGAFISSASAVIVAHNHPSGDPHPSREDIAFTATLRRAGEIIGVQIVDHLVVCPESRSFRSVDAW
jgi:DNA repair protein RadC